MLIWYLNAVSKRTRTHRRGTTQKTRTKREHASTTLDKKIHQQCAVTQAKPKNAMLGLKTSKRTKNTKFKCPTYKHYTKFKITKYNKNTSLCSSIIFTMNFIRC